MKAQFLVLCLVLVACAHKEEVKFDYTKLLFKAPPPTPTPTPWKPPKIDFGTNSGKCSVTPPIANYSAVQAAADDELSASRQSAMIAGKIERNTEDQQKQIDHLKNDLDFQREQTQHLTDQVRWGIDPY